MRSTRSLWATAFVDYAKENGAWKLMRSNLAPLFRNHRDLPEPY
jgi:hypothetical protein